MTFRPKLWCATIALLVPASLLQAQQPNVEKKPETKKPATGGYMRVQKDEKGTLTALDTAIVRFVPATGEGNLSVDLIGVVHIADKGYYEKLNERFNEYDVVLFEMVGPKDAPAPKKGKKEDNPLAMIQKMAGMFLDLDFQKDHIDYTKKNFVHADLSPEQMAEAMKNRGEDGFTLALGVAADLLRQQNLQERKRKNEPAKPEPQVDLMGLLFDPEGAIKMKRIMAQQFADMDSLDAGLGQTINTLLITDRNQAAMKVFQTELAKGKKKIGIFYGAGHMADFEKRLKADFGMKRGSETWLTAWDLKKSRKRVGIEDLLKQIP